MVIGNARRSRSRCSPRLHDGERCRNEFTEATSDLYLAALIEIGLLLFVVTVRKRSRGSSCGASAAREGGAGVSRVAVRATNAAMNVLAALAASSSSCRSC